MSANCFIDTNVLIYCYTNDEPEKQQKALDIANSPDTFISHPGLNGTLQYPEKEIQPFLKGN